LDKQEEHSVSDIKGHIHPIRNNSSNSGYSDHILSTRHTYLRVTDTWDVIRTGRKGRYLNTLGKYYIYKISSNNFYMNDMYIDTYNPIFQTLHELYDK
jgi:hypothetical protein